MPKRKVFSFVYQALTEDEAAAERIQRNLQAIIDAEEVGTLNMAKSYQPPGDEAAPADEDRPGAFQ